MLFRETVAVYCDNHTGHTDTLCGQNADFLDVTAGGHIVTTLLYRVNKDEQAFILEIICFR
jgi:hypothetical protein